MRRLRPVRQLRVHIHPFAALEDATAWGEPEEWAGSLAEDAERLCEVAGRRRAPAVGVARPGLLRRLLLRRLLLRELLHVLQLAEELLRPLHGEGQADRDLQAALPPDPAHLLPLLELLLVRHLPPRELLLLRQRWSLLLPLLPRLLPRLRLPPGCHPRPGLHLGLHLHLLHLLPPPHHHLLLLLHRNLLLLLRARLPPGRRVVARLGPRLHSCRAALTSSHTVRVHGRHHVAAAGGSAGRPRSGSGSSPLLPLLPVPRELFLLKVLLALHLVHLLQLRVVPLAARLRRVVVRLRGGCLVSPRRRGLGLVRWSAGVAGLLHLALHLALLLLH